MLQTQKEYIDFLSLCKDSIDKTKIEIKKTNDDSEVQLFNGIDSKTRDKNSVNTESMSLSEWITTLQSHISNTDLIVPVIGAFSAGKSSLLNLFLGKKYLSEGIAPETALATELHYNVSEYIEAVKENGSIEKFSINDGEILKERAPEFSFLRFYINAEKLKAIEPLVLVDMPGFESPLDSHNRAIFQYAQKGVYFIALQSIEDGNITKTMLRKLEEIDRFERRFSFFISKTNLKPSSEIAKVQDYIQQQLHDNDFESEVMLLDNKENDNLKKVLEAINAEGLIKDIFATTLQSLAFDINNAIKTKIESYKRSKEENDYVLQKKVEEMQRVEQEQIACIQEARGNSSRQHANRIINNVVRKLNNSADEIAQAYKSRGQSGADCVINDLIRSSLSAELKDSMGDIANGITSRIDSTLSSMQSSVNTDALAQSISITDSIDSVRLGKGVQILLTESIRTLAKSKIGVLASIGGALKFTLPVLNPIVGILVSLIPSVLVSIFGRGSKKPNEQEEMRQIENAVISEVIPEVKRVLERQIPEIFDNQVEEMIKEISANYKDRIEQERQAVELAQKEMESQSANIESMVATCKEAIDSIQKEVKRLF